MASSARSERQSKAHDLEDDVNKATVGRIKVAISGTCHAEKPVTKHVPSVVCCHHDACEPLHDIEALRI